LTEKLDDERVQGQQIFRRHGQIFFEINPNEVHQIRVDLAGLPCNRKISRFEFFFGVTHVTTLMGGFLRLPR
jgi:hypothetical protein